MIVVPHQDGVKSSEIAEERRAGMDPHLVIDPWRNGQGIHGPTLEGACSIVETTHRVSLRLPPAAAVGRSLRQLPDLDAIAIHADFWGRLAEISRQANGTAHRASPELNRRIDRPRRDPPKHLGMCRGAFGGCRKPTRKAEQYRAVDRVAPGRRSEGNREADSDQTQD